MFALSVRPYWAYAIFHLGKDIENRNWSSELRGRILIHSSNRFSNSGFDRFNHLIETLGYHPISKEDLIFGAIIGSVEIADCTKESQSPWFVGQFGFTLSSPERFRYPIATTGLSGFWKT